MRQLRWTAALLCALCVMSLPAQAAALPDGESGWSPPETLTSAAQLTVYPAGKAETVPVGTWLEFKVERGGQPLTYMDLTYEIVAGRDCAAVYYNGEIMPLGEGEVVVKAFLDADPSVFGYGRVQVVPAEGETRYAAVREPAGSAAPLDPAFEGMIEPFPESYKPGLRALHAAHPQWVFEPMFTGLGFWDSVSVEASGDRNLTLRANVSDSLKSYAPGDYDRESGEFINKDTGWVETNAAAVAYFMDPRNFLDEQSVFQFESLLYDEAFHTLSGVQGILAGSFMEGDRIEWVDRQGAAQTSSRSYAQAILDAAAETGVNPYYLAAKIRHEIGASPSRSATGTCAGYEGLYNLYNIGATDGEGNIERGLEWAGRDGAYNRPWTSPEASILGGAMYIAENYVGTGQETGYLQKWNVAPHTTSTLYLHQYMTNVSGALSLAQTAYSGYAEIGALDAPIVFSIPVYDNMPGADSPSTDREIAMRETAGTAADAVWLRTGAGAYYPQSGVQLRAGERVRILRAVQTDAAYFMNWLFFPHWYEVQVERDGRAITGYVSERFVTPAAPLVLSPGESRPLRVLLGAGETVDWQIRFVSENEGVAAVDSDGTVYAQGGGRTTLYGYTAGGGFCEIPVMVAPAE